MDRSRRDALRNGDGGAEPGLAEALRAVRGRVTIADRPPAADAYVVCVPTPAREDHTADLTAVESALADVAAAAPSGALVSLSSTVPVGTTELLAEHYPRLQIAFCPERVLPRRAVHEVGHNDRVVGGVDRASTEAIAQLWEGVSEGRVWRTDARTAELVKLMENASRDAEIAVANTVALLADAYGCDPHEVRALANRHPRVELMMPGIGVGGHCLPVDPWFAIQGAPHAGRLFAACREVNDSMAHRAVEQVRAAAPPHARIAVLGLAYKPETDDCRNAPALWIARRLAEERDVVVHDPFCAVPDDLRAVSLAHALAQPVVVGAVAHQAYTDARFSPGQVTVDLCGVWRRVSDPPR